MYTPRPRSATHMPLPTGIGGGIGHQGNDQLTWTITSTGCLDDLVHAVQDGNRVASPDAEF